MKKRKKISKLDAYVIFSIAMLIAYTIVSIFIGVIYDVELETLTTCFFAAFGGEILWTCLIKIFKLKKYTSGEEEIKVEG